MVTCGMLGEVTGNGPLGVEVPYLRHPMRTFETIAFRIGLPKTGSTAIQVHLAGQTAVLERHGWCYFGGEIFGQDVGINATVLMWTLSGGRGVDKLPGHEDNEPSLVEIFHRWAREQKAKHLLISAENLASFDESRWRLILDALAPYRSQKTAIRTLSLVRHPLTRTLSSRNQLTKVAGGCRKTPVPGIRKKSTDELSQLFAGLFGDCSCAFEVQRFEDL